jgi:hypothetical protein
VLTSGADLLESIEEHLRICLLNGRISMICTITALAVHGRRGKYAK